jgi:hypothetical protein
MEARLNTEAVRDDFGIEAWYPYKPNDDIDADNNTLYHVRVVNGLYHIDPTLTGDKLERKMFVGVCLSYVTPNTNGTLYGTVPTSKNPAIALANGKRIKSGIHMLNPRGKCMMLADCSTGSILVVCLMITGTKSLYSSCGNSAFAHELTMGDVIGVYEPTISTRSLGSIPIFDDWTRIVPMKRNLSLPERPIIMSPTANLQVHFYKSAVSIKFYMAQILTGNSVKCTGVTCDRQGTTCMGCHGYPESKRNFVLQTQVEVLNQPQYDAKTKRAIFVFRSFQLTKLLIDINTFAGMDYQIMMDHNTRIRLAINNFADHINNNGGWTVIGWHRRGVVSGMEDGSTQLNEYTSGHLVRLEPTNLTDASIAAMQPFRYTPAQP